eukprot:UN26701
MSYDQETCQEHDQCEFVNDSCVPKSDDVCATFDTPTSCIDNGCPVNSELICEGPACSALKTLASCESAGCVWKADDCSGPACSTLNSDDVACDAANGCSYNSDAQQCAHAGQLSGTVTGLDYGETIMLSLNDGTPVQVVPENDGTFTLPGNVQIGHDYVLTMSQQPEGMECTISNGEGTATGPNTDITIDCQPVTSTVGGTVTGLDSGDTITL